MLQMVLFSSLYDCLCPWTTQGHDVIMVIEKNIMTTGSILGLHLEVIVAHLGLTPKRKYRSPKMIPTFKRQIVQ